MKLTETLEELLEMFGARMVSESADGSYSITSHKGLPYSATRLISAMSMSAAAITALGKPQVIDYDHQDISYDMKPGSQEALRALLFLATEKERYQKFCKSIDEEIIEELDTNET